MLKAPSKKLAWFSIYIASPLLLITALYSYAQAYLKGGVLSPSDWLAMGIAYTIISLIVIYQSARSENLRLAILLTFLLTGALFVIGFLTKGTVEAYRGAAKGADATASWIQADASIIGLAIAIGLPYFQFAKQAKIEKERLRNELAGAIRSIKEELSIFYDGLLTEVSDWEKKESGSQDRFCIPTDAFAIYNGNINNIGKIDNVDIGKRIIRTYGKCADFLSFADLTNKAADVEFQNKDQETSRIFGIQKGKLVGALETLKTEMKTLLDDIDAYERSLMEC